jgi:hypothetical protein
MRKAFRKELTFWGKVMAQLLREASEGGHLKPGVDPQASAVLLMCAWEGLRHHWQQPSP